MYLLDTDTVIYSLKGDETVLNNLRAHLHDPMKMSIVSLMELYFGAYKSEMVAANLARVRRIESSMEILPVGDETAETFGMLKATQQRSGTPLDDFDLVIAGCALAHNLILVTNNVKHFRRIKGLVVENWCIESKA